MNRHQVLTGAANSNSFAFATGSVEGIHFTVSSVLRRMLSVKVRMRN